MTNFADNPPGVTRDEWIDLVTREKNLMYMAIDCASVAGPHATIMKMLANDDRLAQSKFGKRYIRETADLETLLTARDHLDSAIENALGRAFGSGSLKYWGSG